MRTATIKRTPKALLLALLTAVALFVSVSAASAAPQWRLESRANTTVSSGGTLKYYLLIRNVGDQPANGASEMIELQGSLPSGLTVQAVSGGGFECPTLVPGSQDFSCQNSEELTQYGGGQSDDYGRVATVTAQVDPGLPDPSLFIATFSVSGGGAGPATTKDSTRITAAPPVFGIDAFDVRPAAADESLHTRAGAHPETFTTVIDANTRSEGSGLPIDLKGDLWPVEPVRDLVAELPPGFLANPSAVARCDAVELANAQNTKALPLCPTDSQIGMVRLFFSFGGDTTALGPLPVFNMEPASGSPARLGFNVAGTVVVLDAKLRSGSDYGVSIFGRNISQGLPFGGSELEVWNDPSAASHDRDRACPGVVAPWEGGPTCEGKSGDAYLRLPTSCGPLPFGLHLASWKDHGPFEANGEPDLSDPAWDSRGASVHQDPGYPSPPSEWGTPQPIEGCGEVPVEGDLEVEPTTPQAETSSGLDVNFEIPNPGLANADAQTSTSDVKKVKVTLPRGVTINPSQADGLGVCTPAQYKSTVLSFQPTPGKGCPDDSKVGSVEVKTPLLDEKIPGDVYVAQQDDPSTGTPGAENPFDSLLAIYVVLKEPQRGVLVKLPGKVDLEDPAHPGQIVATFDDLPQQPFSSFEFHFREGARAPLVTPPTCGTYTTKAEIWGHSDPTGAPAVSESSFAIDRGIGGGPCPSGAPGFKPGFLAGSVDNNAGSFSPFLMRLSRLDGEQNLTKFSSVLPPGVVAKIAGVEKCSEAQIAAAMAKGRTGRQELAGPSCPSGSQIGHTLAGAGVGSVLTRVGGKIYLAGPYNGAPLSVVAITPAVAGPFDVGVVVVRVALSLDPRTAEVHVDGERSDPIPHILRGIPLKLRDLRVYVDRDNFTINPTSCAPGAVGATLWGSAANAFDPADDVPVSLASRYQAANCASLGFKPSLTINLRGGAKRGQFPALRALFKPRPGDANLARTVVKLPRSAFLEQGHIRTVCTRVQFAADACPPGAVYGRVTAWTPLLDEPLKGPAYLRSSDNKLPDLVFDLHGVVDIETSARIDSVRGGIRATFPFVPDAPLTKVLVEMQGGKKGLIVNSRNICASTNRANVQTDGHNGKVSDSRPPLKAQCDKRRKGGRR